MSNWEWKNLSNSQKLIRVVAVANFSICAVTFVTPARQLMDRGFNALKAVNLDRPVGRSLQFWLVGSTLLLPILLGLAVWRAKKAMPAEGVWESVKVEATMVGAWWAIVVLSVLYFGSLGAGG
jgi:hypothetical protein